MTAFSEVDNIVKSQLQQFAPLTAIIDANRIRFPDRNFDLSKIKETGDLFEKVWIVPSQSNNQTFSNSEKNNAVFVYDIIILSPADNFEKTRPIQYQITRAAVLLQDCKNAAGVALDTSAITPLKFEHSSSDDWRHSFDAQSGVIESTKSIRIQVNYDIADLVSTAAPTPTSGVEMMHDWADLFDRDSNQVIALQIEFNQIMAAVRTEDPGSNVFTYHDSKGTTFVSIGYWIRPASNQMVILMEESASGGTPLSTLLYGGGIAELQSSAGTELGSFSLAITEA